MRPTSDGLLQGSARARRLKLQAAAGAMASAMALTRPAASQQAPVSVDFSRTVTGLNGFVRDGLLQPTDQGRRGAGELSDKLLLATVAAPSARNLAYGALTGDFKGAFGALVIDGATQGVSFGLNQLGKRELRDSPLGVRPYASVCVIDRDYDRGCATPEMINGGVSGHSQAVMTALGISLAHLAYDKNAPPTLFEVSSFALSGATVMMLRIMSDQHTAEQTLKGAGLGLAVGFGVPSLFQLSGLGYEKWSNRTGQNPFHLVPYIAPVFASTANVPTIAGFEIGLRGTF